jgi:hypothetical protein
MLDALTVSRVSRGGFLLDTDFAALLNRMHSEREGCAYLPTRGA